MSCGILACGHAAAQQAVAPSATAAVEAQPEFTLPAVVVKPPKKNAPPVPAAAAADDGEDAPTPAKPKKKIAKKKKQPAPNAAPSVAASSSSGTETTSPVPVSPPDEPASSAGFASSADRNAVGPGSAGRTEISSRIVEQVTSVDEVTAAQIQNSGAKTLNEAINLLPGLYVRNGADGVPRIDIRGLRTRNVQLLLDGVPLNSTFDGQFDHRAIPVENIARIEVTRVLAP